MAVTSVQAPKHVVLLTTQTVDETTSDAVHCEGFPNIVVYLKSTGVTSSGVVTIEEADDENYAGTWSEITTVNASDVTGGAEVAVHLEVGAYGWVRVRISTVIGGGGSISAYLKAS